MSNIRTFVEPHNGGAWAAVDDDRPGYRGEGPTEAKAIEALREGLECLDAQPSWSDESDLEAQARALRELIPTLPVARDVVNSDTMMRVYACPEYEELSQDGQAWADALVAEARRPLIEAIMKGAKP
jgi:hypothetical protein